MNWNFNFQTIMQSRNDSWALVGLIAISGALAVRHLILADLLRRVRKKNRTWYRRMQRRYQKEALLGWLFFCAAVAGVTLSWLYEGWFLKLQPAGFWTTVFLGLFAVSFTLHLKLYAKAAFEAVSEDVPQAK